MYGFRRDIDSAALANYIAGAVDPIFRISFQHDLKLKLIVPVAWETAVCKRVEMVHKFG